jgi:hypothetical protein
MQDAGNRNEDAASQDERRGRLDRVLGGRPLSVFVILLAGIGVLAVLLAIVYLTGRGSGGGEPTLTCLPVALSEAQTDISQSMVERMNVVTEQNKPEKGPLAVTLHLNDGNCRELPKGVPAQPDLYAIIGFVTVFNESRAGEQRIRLDWEQQPNIPPALLATATPTPTVTPPPTATPPPTVTPLPPTATPVPPTPTPVPPTPTATPRPPTPTPMTKPAGAVSPTATAASISAPVADNRPTAAPRAPVPTKPAP